MADSFDDIINRNANRGERRSTEELQTQFNDAVPPPKLQPVVNNSGEGLIGGIGRQASNFFQTAADEAVLGLTRPVNTMLFGTGTGLYDYATGYRGESGEENFFGVMGEAYDRAYENTDARLDKAVDELGPIGTILASITGNATPMAPVKQFDNALDAGKNLMDILAPKVGDDLWRAGRSAVAAGSTSALQGYFQGQDSVEEMVANGGLGFAMGGTLQKLLGDTALPMVMNIKSAEGALLKSIADYGPNVSENLNLGAIARAVDTGDIGARGFLNAPIGGSPNYRQWGKVNDAIADFSMGSIDPRTLQTPQAAAIEERFVRTQNVVRQAIDTVNTEARDRFRVALDNPQGRKEALYQNNQDLSSARAIYDRMGRTDTAESLGNTPFNPRAVLDRATTALKTDSGRRKSTELSPEYLKMHNIFKDLIRGREVETVARGIGNIPSTGKTSPRADEIFPTSLPMVRLMDARRTFSDLLSPSMAFKNGTSRTELRAGMQILKAVDEQLDEMTNDGFGLAKGAFAKAMRVEEAYELGGKIYNQRHIEVQDQEAFSKFYGEYVGDMLKAIETADSPEVAQSIKAGFKNAMFDQVGRRGFLSEMQNFIGPPDTAGNNFFKGKGENYNLLRQILGDEDLSTVMKLYTDGKRQERYMSLLRDNLQAAGEDPQSVWKLSKMLAEENSDFMPTDTPGVALGAVRSLYQKLMKPSDRKKAMAAMDLLSLEGPDLENLIRRGVISARGGAPINIGARTGAAIGFGDMFSEDNDIRNEQAQQDNQAAIDEYLKAIGLQGN
jgi:hypothetical protein